MRLDRINAITATALERAADTQPWPDQFRRRRAEFELLLRHVSLPPVGRVLEIGCGNAFGSVLLADEARFVVATDLARPDVATHSIGMESPRKLIERLSVTNCALASASAEDLPFRDGSFDLLFSFYVLEHVPDKPRAFAEMHRVLQPDGMAIAFVPNYVERLYAPVGFYLYLAGRAVQRLRGSRQADTEHAATEATQVHSVSDFRSAHPHFPFPEPHGAYEGSWEELKSHLPATWKRHFEASGFEIQSSFHVMTLPANLLEPIVGRRITGLYDRLVPVDSALSRLGLGKYLGQYSCYVARRKA